MTWKDRVTPADARTIESRIRAGEQLTAAGELLSRSMHTYAIVRPLGSKPRTAPGVAIGERSHLGLQKAMNRAQDLFPDATAWEICVSDRNSSVEPAHADPNQPSQLRSGELHLLEPLILARIGFDG